MIANSTCVQARIKQYYGRDSVVVHPPVDTERFVLGEEDRKGYIVAGRQTPYKRIDLAVAACSEAGLPLKVIGNGPEHDKLVRLARPTIEFLTGVSDADMPEHFAGARAFIFANEDDFGIVPVEAMATGTPVIAFRKGGALDYVRPGVSGQFFDTQTAECLANALKEFEKTSYDPKAVRLVAEEFSAVHFQRGIEQVVSGAFGK